MTDSMASSMSSSLASSAAGLDTSQQRQTSWVFLLRTRLEHRDASIQSVMNIVRCYSKLREQHSRVQQAYERARRHLEDIEEEKEAGTPQSKGAKSDSFSKKRIDELNRKNEELTKEIIDLYRQVKEKREQEVEALRSAEELKKQVEDLKLKISQLEDTIAIKSTQLESCQEEIKNLRIQCSTVTDAMTSYQLEYVVASEQLDQAKRENAQLVEQILAVKKEQAEFLNSQNEHRERKNSLRIKQDLLDAAGDQEVSEASSAGSADIIVSSMAPPTRATHMFEGHSGEAFACAYGTGSGVFATGGSDGLVKIWTHTGQNRHILKHHAGTVTCVDFHIDGEHLISASNDKTVVMWSLRSGRVKETLAGHTDHVLSACFSSACKYIFSTSKDRTIRVWDADRGRSIKYFQPHSGCHGVVASNSNDRFFTVHHDARIREWDLRQDSRKAARTLNSGHDQPVTSIVKSMDGTMLATASRDGTINIHDGMTCDVTQTVADPDLSLPSAGTKPCFSPNNQYLAVGTMSGGLFVWNGREGAKHCLIEKGGHSGPITCSTWLASSNQVVTVGRDGKIGIWTE